MEENSLTEQPEQQTESSPPRGRPWVKGQSGNPAGRPPRRHQAAVVAEHLIGRKTIPLTEKLLALALDGDKAALRMCLDRIAPPRREPPPWLMLPPIDDYSKIRTAMAAVATAAGDGEITTAQAARLTRMLEFLWYHF